MSNYLEQRPAAPEPIERPEWPEMASQTARDMSKPVKQSRDRAQYVRQQKGHSLILHLFLIGPVTLWIPAIYYSVSPNHFWHA
jgi:hypothetical protein